MGRAKTMRSIGDGWGCFGLPHPVLRTTLPMKGRENSLPLPEHPREDGVDVFEVVGVVEQVFEFGVRQGL